MSSTSSAVAGVLRMAALALTHFPRFG